MKQSEKLMWAARVVLLDADQMTAKGRRAVANWLRKQATQLEEDGPEYHKRFTVTYWYQCSDYPKKRLAKKAKVKVKIISGF